MELPTIGNRRFPVGNHRTTPVATILCVVIAALGGCTLKKITVPGEEFRSLDGKAPFIKAHMQSGNLYVLSAWEVDEENRTVSGTGTLFDPNRNELGRGAFTVGVDSVALFESNVKQASSAVGAITFISAISVAITVYCAINPKSCFGSCPTFYLTDGGREALRAEGFSASVAPWLEASDVDDLRRLERGDGGRVDLVMRNEALETHVVRRADLLAVPLGEGERVLKGTDGEFWRVSDMTPPASCRAAEGDILESVRDLDGTERFSRADSFDLAARETIDVRFDRAPGPACGLVVASRQTLLSTYLLYETLSNAGTSAGTWLAALSKYEARNPLARALGAIQVEVRDAGGEWRRAGEAGEVGPLATDVYFVPLPAAVVGKPVDVRLRLTKGAWRIDQIALAALGERAGAVRIPPAEVLREGRDDDGALAALWDSSSVLTTMPGDAYTLRYELPDDGERYELFLESRGYYLEWIRSEWLADENPAYVREMLFEPRSALRRLARSYKEVEESMEDTFWRSRYARPPRR